VRFIAGHKDRAEGGLRWGVESICVVLREQGCPIAPSTYYDAIGRPPFDEKVWAQIVRELESVRLDFINSVRQEIVGVHPELENLPIARPSMPAKKSDSHETTVSAVPSDPEPQR
jgi:hypothetical protein